MRLPRYFKKYSGTDLQRASWILLRLDHGLNGDIREWLTGSDNVLWMMCKEELALLMYINQFTQAGDNEENLEYTL